MSNASVPSKQRSYATMQKCTPFEFTLLRSDARTVGIDIKQGPKGFTLSGKSIQTLELVDFSDVKAYVASRLKDATIYDDGTVVVHKGPNGILHAYYLKSGSRELRTAVSGEEWSLYAHDDGAMLNVGNAPNWVLTGDVSGLLSAGICDKRTQWRTMFERLDMGLEQTSTLVPFLADLDQYAVGNGLFNYVQRKSPRQDDCTRLILPVIQATIQEHHRFKKYWQDDGSADLAVAVAQSIFLGLDPEDDIESIFALVQRSIKEHEVKYIILHKAQFLGYGGNLNAALEKLLLRAQSWGCKVALVGDIEFCWERRMRLPPIGFDLILPRKPAGLEPLFETELRQYVAENNRHKEVTLTTELAQAIWTASGCDRAKSIALCHALDDELTEQKLAQIVNCTLV